MYAGSLISLCCVSDHWEPEDKITTNSKTIHSKEMGRGQNTRKNIQWRVEEWKRHVVVVCATVTRMIMKMTVMILSTVFPSSSKGKNEHTFSSTHLPSSYLPAMFLPQPTSTTATSPHISSHPSV